MIRRQPLRRSVAAVLCTAIALLGLGVAPHLTASAVSTLHRVASAAAIGGLRGVTVDGSEYACIQGWGVTERPIDASLVSDLKETGATVVRLPLNEDCWLGINSTSAYTGAVYQSWLDDAVSTLTAAGLAVDLDLHWTAAGTDAATRQANMPDSHSLVFWTQVAARYKNNPRVLYEAFNEPIGISNGDSNQNWACLRDGGSACPGLADAVGMQAIVDAIRATGATQPIIVNGLGYAQIMTQYLAYLPHDPLNNLVAGVHMPAGWCPDVACWDREYAPVASVMPMIATETYDGGTLPVNPRGTIYQATQWLDAHDVGQIAWTDNTWGDNQSLRNGDGSLSSWGWLWRSHVRASTGIAGNQIVDGGFENGWGGANSLYFGTSQIVPWGQHSGGYSEQLNAANDGVGQALGGLTPGQPYTATVWATNKVAGQATCLAVASKDPVCSSNSTYTHLSTTFTPTTTSATVLVYKQSGYDASWIDDLAVTGPTAQDVAAQASATPSGLPAAGGPVSPTIIASATNTAASTATSTATATSTVTATSTSTATASPTASSTATATTIPSATATRTALPTSTATPNAPATIAALRTQVALLSRRVDAYATAVARVRGAVAPLP